MSTNRPARRLVAATAILLAALAAGTVATAGARTDRAGWSAFTSGGTHFTDVVRLEADSATAASLAWSDQTFKGTVDTVVIARDDNFPDALAAGPLLADAPLLLTPTSHLHDDVAAEIQRLSPRHAIVLGGTAAISPDVVVQLEGLGLDVRRIGGADRVATAALIAADHASGRTGGDVLIARAWGADGDPTRAWADSLTAGAYAAWSSTPVLLTATERLSPAAADALAAGGYDTVHVIGGPDAVSEQAHDDIVEATDADVRRVAGPDRAATATAIATTLWQASGSEHTRAAVLLNGTHPLGWSAGFPSPPWSASATAPVVLTADDELPSTTATWLAGGGRSLVCGPNVTDATCELAHSPQPVLVTGDVTYTDHNPVPGAQVSIVPDSSFAGAQQRDAMVTTSSAESGSYGILVPVGIYASVDASDPEGNAGSTAGPHRFHASVDTHVVDVVIDAMVGPGPDGSNGSGGGGGEGTNDTVRLRLTNDAEGALWPLADSSGLAPGHTSTRRIEITSEGDRAPIRMTVTADGDATDHLHITVVADPDGAATPVFDGTLTELAANHGMWPDGLDEWVGGNGDSRTYAITVAIPATVGNDAQGTAASADFLWEARR